MYFAGLDVGSAAAKALILRDNRVVAAAIQPTGWNPKEAARMVFEAALTEAGRSRSEISGIVGTGYGRVALDFVDQTVTEITCHALGASHCFPGNNVVIDIGGQDSKAIKVGDGGKVLNFVMNDKCAAGTGRFLQVMALTLGVELDQLENLPWAEPVVINSMCTVFAESEVVSLLASGVPKERIVAGLYHSVARRIATMTGPLGTVNGVTFTGGVARNTRMREMLAKVLGHPVDTPAHPQLIGALGAALLAARLRGGSL